MKAITLWQPHAWAVAHAGKDVENRVWRPPENLLGKVIAIHAGKRVDERVIGEMQAGAWYHVSGKCVLCPDAKEITRGAIVAVATLGGVLAHQDNQAPPIYPWYCGEGYGWVLRGTIALPTPLPCRGAQGLWNVPPDLLDKIRDQLAKVDELREEPL